MRKPIPNCGKNVLFPLNNLYTITSQYKIEQNKKHLYNNVQFLIINFEKFLHKIFAYDT